MGGHPRAAAHEESLADLNAVIDESAVAAGRAPGSIRRLVNIEPDAAAPDRLARLALEHGISGFILASDDEATITAFGQQTAPATRDLVEAARVEAARVDAGRGLG